MCCYCWKKSALVMKKIKLLCFPSSCTPDYSPEHWHDVRTMFGISAFPFVSWMAVLTEIPASVIYESRYVPPERMSAWGREKGFDLTVLLKYDCKIRIRWQSLWGRDISACPAQCLACFGCCVINSRGWVMGDALKSCLLTLKSWGAVLSSCCY